MEILGEYLNLSNGKRTEKQVLVKKEIFGDVSAYYIDGIAKYTLDKDFGAGIDISIENLDSTVADFRDGEFWCSVQFGNGYSDIPDETQGLLYKKKDGIIGIILPVVSEKYKCVLAGNENCVTAKLYSHYEYLFNIKCLAFVAAEGKNFYELVKNCTETVIKLTENKCALRRERRYPKILEYLGWCTWDAFNIKVSEDKIEKKLDEFKEKNIPVKWIMLDDMWAEVRDFYGRDYETRGEMFELMFSSKLYSFEADSKRFPSGLKETVSKIKERGISVGAWFPVTGYWRGLDPDGEAYKQCKDYLIRTERGTYVPDFKQEKAYMYFDTINSFLKKCGIDFVKIDKQSIVGRYYKNLAPIGVAAEQYHKAMEASVGQNFDNNMINCMCMSSEDMWNRSFSPITRCSDDFKPENSEWFLSHILQSTYNSVFWGHIYYCDYDMWWTDDGQAKKNSLLRAVSGGPIYISDTMDRSRADILKPLMLDDGKILRCDRPATPTGDCIFSAPSNSNSIFKVQNICGDSGAVAVFNLNNKNKKVSGTISPSDVEGISGEEFVVYEHFSKSAVLLKKDETLGVTLNDNDDFKLFIVVPLKDGFAPIGRVDKFISPKSIKAVNGKEVELYENGTYAVWEDGKLLFKEMSL